METQSYKFVSTHAHEISGWNILSRPFHPSATHLGGMNGDVQSDLATLAFNNGEQLEYFHIIIIRLQQEIMILGEIVSPTRLLIQCMKALTKSEKLRAFIAPKMSDEFKTMFTVLSDSINKSNQINTMSSSPTQKDT